MEHRPLMAPYQQTIPGDVPPRVATILRWAQIAVYPALALAAATSGVLYFFDPPQPDISSLAETFGRAAPFWNAAYAASGILVILGLVLKRAEIEGLGLCILGGAIAINCVAIVEALGLDRSRTTIVSLSGFTVGCWARAWFLYYRTKVKAQIVEEAKRAIGAPLG